MSGGMYNGPGELYTSFRTRRKRTRGERMNNEFCVVVRDAAGVPYFVSANVTETEANNLLMLMAEGEVVPAEEGRRLKEQMNGTVERKPY